MKDFRENYSPLLWSQKHILSSTKVHKTSKFRKPFYCFDSMRVTEAEHKHKQTIGKVVDFDWWVECLNPMKRSLSSRQKSHSSDWL